MSGGISEPVRQMSTVHLRDSLPGWVSPVAASDHIIPAPRSGKGCPCELLSCQGYQIAGLLPGLEQIVLYGVGGGGDACGLPKGMCQLSMCRCHCPFMFHRMHRVEDFRYRGPVTVCFSLSSYTILIDISLGKMETEMNFQNKFSAQSSIS